MATATYRPNAAGVTQHSRFGDTANWKCVDEDPHDSDTTYVNNVSAGGGIPSIEADFYNFADPAESGTITNVRVSLVVRSVTVDDVGNPPTFEPGVRIGTTNYYTAPQYPGGTYGLIYGDWALSPATGIAWTFTELNGTLMGLRSTCVDLGGGGSTEVRCTQVFMTVTYTPAGSTTLAAGLGTLTAAGAASSLLMGGVIPLAGLGLIVIQGQSTNLELGTRNEHDLFVFDPRSRRPVKTGVSR